MAISPARKARLKAAKARARRMALVRAADPTSVYLMDANWKGATGHYIETGAVLPGVPTGIRLAIREAEVVNP